MKVIILANNDIGLYNFRKELLGELINKNHQVIISLPNGERVDDLIRMGCNYHKTEIERRSMNILKDLKIIREYVCLIKKERPDYVLTYTIKPNIYGGLASRFCKVKYISTITGLGTAFQKPGLLKLLIIKLYKFALKRANAIVFENTTNLKVFVDHCIIPAEEAVLVNGAGVNIEEYRYSPMKFDEPLRFLFIGRIMAEKGINEFFKAAKRLKTENQYNVEFDVLGFFEDNYKEQIEELDESGIIHYYGFQKDVKSYIEKAHCVVLPSYHEGMSNTLLESAAMGRPIIASDIPGCREAVLDQQSGYLCKAKDSNDLYDKMIQYILLSKDQRLEMGKKSREHIEKNFDREAVVDKILSLMSR